MLIEEAIRVAAVRPDVINFNGEGMLVLLQTICAPWILSQLRFPHSLPTRIVIQLLDIWIAGNVLSGMRRTTSRRDQDIAARIGTLAQGLVWHGWIRAWSLSTLCNLRAFVNYTAVLRVKRKRLMPKP